VLGFGEMLKRASKSDVKVRDEMNPNRERPIRKSGTSRKNQNRQRAVQTQEREENSRGSAAKTIL